jgi:lipoprotein-anchoring transpeptidase ErfK/SrfK
VERHRSCTNPWRYREARDGAKGSVERASGPSNNSRGAKIMRRMSQIVTAIAMLIGSLFVGAPLSADAAQGRCVDVNLSTQTARAMSGNSVVFSAPVSTGTAGWATPTGTFTILRRVASETMSSTTIGIPAGAPGSYHVSNVPYTQYFTNYGHSLHGNWWAAPGIFGNRTSSHGCVGMSTANAARFWNFASVGTPVVIHY